VDNKISYRVIFFHQMTIHLVKQNIIILIKCNIQLYNYIINYNIILSLVAIIHKPYIAILILLYNIDNNNVNIDILW